MLPMFESIPRDIQSIIFKYVYELLTEESRMQHYIKYRPVIESIDDLLVWRQNIGNFVYVYYIHDDDQILFSLDDLRTVFDYNDNNHLVFLFD